MQIRQEKGCYTLYKENEAIGTAVVDGMTILRLEVVPTSLSLSMNTRFSIGALNYAVTDDLGSGAYELTCETAGQEGNQYSGPVVPIDFIEGLESCSVTALLVPGEDAASILTHDGERITVADGGMGGRGNIHFVTSTRRAPAFAELGEPAQERWIELEMKLMADAALVGMPSAGKSSLISKISAARPKIADYPFTTLVPNLGVARSGDLSFVVADIPGLIEGAHEGRGLGHEFLRHIERTAIIVHVVDLTGDWEGRDPLDDYKIINNELALYADELAARPRIVVANKIDVAGTEEALERLKAQVEADSIAAAGGNEFAPSPIDPKVYCISALTGEGVDSLKAAIANQVHELREQARQAEASDVQYEHVWELKREARDKRFTVRKLSEGVFRVVGTQVERMVVQCDWENEEAVVFLQHRLKRVGVEEALEKAGAVDGDEIRICGRAFEFESTRTAADLFEELDI